MVYWLALKKIAPRGAQITSIYVLVCTAEAADVELAGVGVLQRLLDSREGGVQLGADNGESGKEALLDGRNAFFLLDEGLQPIQSTRIHHLPSKEFNSVNLIDDYQKYQK